MSLPLKFRLAIASTLTLAFLVALTATSSANPLQPATSELARTPTPPTTAPPAPTPPTGSLRVSCVGNGGAGVKVSWEYENSSEHQWSMGIVLVGHFGAGSILGTASAGAVDSGQWIAHPSDVVTSIDLRAHSWAPWVTFTLDSADVPDCSRG